MNKNKFTIVNIGDNVIKLLVGMISQFLVGILHDSPIIHTTIGPVVSKIICLIKIQTDGRQSADRQTDRQTDGNRRPISSYSKGHKRSEKHKSRSMASITKRTVNQRSLGEDTLGKLETSLSKWTTTMKISKDTWKIQRTNKKTIMDLKQ